MTTKPTTAPVLKAKLIIGQADILVAVGKIQVAGKKLDGMIQLAGLSILNHIELHHDITVFSSLWDAMPKGSRRKALADWATKYGKLQMNLDEKGKVVADKPFLHDKTKKTDLLGAEAEPWFECAPEKVEDFNMDFEARLAMLLKQADKSVQNGGEVKGAEMLAKVREIHSGMAKAA